MVQNQKESDSMVLPSTNYGAVEKTAPEEKVVTELGDIIDLDFKYHNPDTPSSPVELRSPVLDRKLSIPDEDQGSEGRHSPDHLYEKRAKHSSSRSPSYLKILSNLELSEESAKKKEMSRKEVVSIVFLWTLIAFYVMLIYSILYAFYPGIASYKAGNSVTQIGLVIGAYDLSAGIFFPVWGHLVKYLNVKYTMIGALSVMSVAIAASGLVSAVGGVAFFLINFSLRLLLGVMQAGVTVCAYALVTKFPDSLQGTLIGVFECAFSFGIASGPPLGGALYYVGGYSLPFLFGGALGAFLAFLAFLTVKNDSVSEKEGETPQSEVHFFSWLTHSDYMLGVLGTFLGCGSFLCIGAVLEFHLEHFFLEAYMIGILLGIPSFSYAVSCLIFGHYSSKFGSSMGMILLGLVMVGISMMFLGPAPFLPVEKTLPFIVICLATLGVSSGIASIFSFLFMMEVAKRGGKELNIATSGVLSSWFLSAICAGGALGPTIAGALYKPFGTDTTFTFIGLTSLFTATLYGLWKLLTGKSECSVKSFEDD